MANKSDGRTKRLERWTNDVRRWNGNQFHLGQRAIEALSRAEKEFDLDLRKDRDRLQLLHILADIVFGVEKRGRPRGKKKWDSWRLWQLAVDRGYFNLWDLSDKKAVVEIKKRHPERYRDTSAEMMRQMLQEARREYQEKWNEKHYGDDEPPTEPDYDDDPVE